LEKPARKLVALIKVKIKSELYCNLWKKMNYWPVFSRFEETVNEQPYLVLTLGTWPS
jgi:hypothetical protein